MLQKIKDKLKNKSGSSTLEFVVCMLIFIMVTAFIVDVFIISYKHYVVAANCTKAVRVIAIQGGIGNDCPDNYPGGNPNYMTNKELRNYLNELANTVQGDIGSMNVYLSYSYIDNYDNIITKDDILVYTMNHGETGAVSTTYYPQNFLLPYGSFITLKIEYNYKFFFTDIWFDKDRTFNFHSSKSSVTEYVSYDFSYHINGEPILFVTQNLPQIDTYIGGNYTETDPKYFECNGNTITGLSMAGKMANLTDLVIPREINGVEITQIGENAFNATIAGNEKCARIASITIPNNIKTIRKNAFYGCTNLVTVKYYEGLERIDPYAFAGCYNLKLFAPAYHYQDANQQPGIETPPRIIFPESLQEVHEGAFLNCSLINIVRFGSDIIKIADDAFNGTSVTSIYLNKDEGTVLGEPWRTDLEPYETVNIAWNAVRIKE